MRGGRLISIAAYFTHVFPHASRAVQGRTSLGHLLNTCPSNLDRLLAHQSPAYLVRSQSRMSRNLGSNDGTMIAAVVYEPGGPEVLKLEKRSIPEPVGQLRTDNSRISPLTGSRRKAKCSFGSSHLASTAPKCSPAKATLPLNFLAS